MAEDKQHGEQKKHALTPLMRQFYDIKAQYPDALLLFRAGDFYETFGDDAVKASEILGITLTKRANGSASSVPLAGFPYHAIDNYLDKLVLAGERVAICEQLEDPKQCKGIVPRGVTELVTPGVTYNDNILNHTENTFLSSVFFGTEGKIGVAFLDISTGEYYVCEGNKAFVQKVIASMQPKEMLYNRTQENDFAKICQGSKYSNYRLDEWAWNHATNYEKLTRQFKTKSLKGFGVEAMTLGVTAAGAILHYLQYTKHNSLQHINSISRIDQNKYVLVDFYSQKNLELFYPSAQGGSSLIEIIDSASSPMGKRMLRRWIALPLRDRCEIEKRFDMVDLIRKRDDLRNEIIEEMIEIGDMERIIGKIAAQRAMPREMVQLSRSLGAMYRIKEQCLKNAKDSELETLANQIQDLEEVRTQIATTISAEPAITIGKGIVIAAGVDSELDELRNISDQGKKFLDDMVEREIERTGISSLKISYNNVFGYYIEVRNSHKDKVPQEWIRKQTLVNAERYITEELKEYENKILGAEGRIIQIESRIYTEMIEWMQRWVADLKSSSRIVAEIDVLSSFAVTSLRNNFTRPKLNENGVISIKDLRHPVIERRLPIGESYIPSDVEMNPDNTQIILLSGPNMSGKSALLRSVAIASLMAQCGSFVAASSANIAMTDRIFTRVGANDNISSGESTFMVEMLETANILNNLTDNSLVILDEIGRGTSTYDGISIAWSIVEYIHSNSSAKVLFATHYHELGEMYRKFERVGNFHIAVKEIDDKVIFLRKLVAGAVEHSFGVHVAQMAGMPQVVVSRAREILVELESQRTGSVVSGDGSSPAVVSGVNTKAALSRGSERPMQMSIFQMDDPTLSAVGDQIRDIDINTLTPLEALNKLSEIKKILGIRK